MFQSLIEAKASFATTYDEKLKTYEKLREIVGDRILPQVLFDLHGVAISGRVKDKASALKKIEKYEKRLASGESLEECMIDLVGIRVVCVYLDQVDEVIRRVLSTFECDQRHFSDKYLLDDENPEGFGYRAVHCVGRLGTKRSALEEYSKYSDLTFEIQVRTIVQDAWSNFSHRAYKGSPSPAIRRRLAVMAAMFELADREFLEIRKLYEAG